MFFFIYVIETEATESERERAGKKSSSEIELMHAFAWICTNLCKYQRKRKLNVKVNEPYHQTKPTKLAERERERVMRARGNGEWVRILRGKVKEAGAHFTQQQIILIWF